AKDRIVKYRVCPHIPCDNMAGVDADARSQWWQSLGVPSRVQLDHLLLHAECSKTCLMRMRTVRYGTAEVDHDGVTYQLVQRAALRQQLVEHVLKVLSEMGSQCRGAKPL